MESKTNILLTCCGRKSYLVPLFEASEGLGTLVAVDSDPQASIRHHTAHFYQVPPISPTQDYIHALSEISVRHSIDCILPQNDIDLVVLSEARPHFESLGVRVAGASPEVVATLKDKYCLQAWMRQKGLPYPVTRLADEVAADDLPCLVKARVGQGNAGLGRCSDLQELERLRGLDLIFQPEIHGQEFTLDILRSPETGVVSVIPIEKLEMHWGSTSKAVAANRQSLLDLGVQVGEKVASFGPLDVDVILSPSGEATIIDLNPRVGGCFPFAAHFCGGHVDALLQICGGESPAPRLGEFETGLRVDKEFRFFAAPGP